MFTLRAFTLAFSLSIAGTNLASTDDDILSLLPSILAGVKPLPRPIDFKVRTPSLDSGNSYTIDLARWDIPNNGSQAVKTTDNLQAALDWAAQQGYQQVVIPNGNFLVGRFGNAIYHRGIELASNTELVLSSNTTLRMSTNDKWNYCVIAVNGKENVIIRGGRIVGDRNTHIFTPRSSDGKTAHDEGHGICLQGGTKRVLVEDMDISQLTGDGLLLVNNIEDVTVRRNKIHHNRRQGVSVVGGIRIAIENNEIHHIRGTAPQFGVDIEGAGRVDRDILIRKNNFHHNRGGDVVNTSGKNVFIIKNTMHQGVEGLDNRYIDGPIVTWERTDNVIAQNEITMLNGSVNGRLGYIQYSRNRDDNPTTTFVWDNTCHGCGMYMYRANNADIRRNKFYGYFLSLSEFKNATLIDNQVTYGPPGSPRYCWTYRIRETTGLARANTLEGTPISIPLSNTPWTSDCLRN